MGLAEHAGGAHGSAGRNRSAEPEAAIRERLEKIRAYRGALMPNHAVLAIEFPDLLDAYESLYRATTLTFNVLAPAEKKFVLLVVVSSARIALGAHHVGDFLKVGGTGSQVKAAVRLAMLVRGSALLDDVGPGWNEVVPGLSYEELCAPEREAASWSGVQPAVVELALSAGHAACRAWVRVAFHIAQAKRLGAADAAVAEALTTLILPVGNPVFVQACDVWQGAIARNEIDASPLHRDAAAMR